MEELTGILREAVGDKAAEQALARALRVLEGTAPALARTPVAAAPAAAAAEGIAAEAAPEIEEPAVEEPPVDAAVLALEARGRPGRGRRRDRPASSSSRPRRPTRRPAASPRRSTPATSRSPSRRPTPTCTSPSSTCTSPAAGVPRRPTSSLLLGRLIELDGDGPARDAALLGDRGALPGRPRG